MTATFVAMGSAPYMPPEQAEGKKVGPAADIYGLGTILYTLALPPAAPLRQDRPGDAPEGHRRGADSAPLPAPRDSPRSRGDLPPVPGEGPGTSIPFGPRPGRRPGPVPGRQADPGTAPRPPRASQAQGPAQSFRRDPVLHQHAPRRDDPGRNLLVPVADSPRPGISPVAEKPKPFAGIGTWPTSGRRARPSATTRRPGRSTCSRSSGRPRARRTCAASAGITSWNDATRNG